MSLETTMAEADRRHAETAWLLHRRDCPVCNTAIRSRKPAQMCRRGAEKRGALREAEAEVRRNKELDALPSPDQEPLFDLADLGLA